MKVSDGLISTNVTRLDGSLVILRILIVIMISILGIVIIIVILRFSIFWWISSVCQFGVVVTFCRIDQSEARI